MSIRKWVCVFALCALAAVRVGAQTGASINGRLYAQTAVNIASATVTAPAP